MKERQTAFTSSLILPPSSFQILRLYEAVVAVLSLVEDAQPVGVRVAEDDELVAVVGERHRGLLGRHRLNLVAARVGDARRPAVGRVAVRGRIGGGRGRVVGRGPRALWAAPAR